MLVPELRIPFGIFIILKGKCFAINLPTGQLVQVKSLGSRKDQPPEVQHSIRVATISSPEAPQLCDE